MNTSILDLPNKFLNYSNVFNNTLNFGEIGIRLNYNFSLTIGN